MSDAWFRYVCPKCAKPNWVSEPSDECAPFYHANRCWKCKHAYWKDEDVVKDEMEIYVLTSDATPESECEDTRARPPA